MSSLAVAQELLPLPNMQHGAQHEDLQGIQQAALLRIVSIPSPSSPSFGIHGHTTPRSLLVM